MMKILTQEETYHGQAIYTKKSLAIYDWYVTKFSNRFVWRCPRNTLIQFFKENTSLNHLDIGVGTGYFLEQLHLVPMKQRLGLLDMNEHCLNYANQKLKSFQPEIYHHDIFEKFTTVTQKFDSVSLNYVLHCLPGHLSQKAIAFDNIRDVLNPGGKLFGSTILGKGVNKNWLAKNLLTIYNKKKIMNNLNDDYASLHHELTTRFSNVTIHIKGSVALFVAR